MARAMLHLNDNLLCSVAIQTTGPSPIDHEIWNICILPLDSKIEPLKTIIPFYTSMKPDRIDTIDPKFISRENLTQSCLTGLDQNMTSDMILSWFDKIGLPRDKKIQPLAYNWPNIYSFFTAWMGWQQTNIIFHQWYRDLIPYSLYANDSADLNVEQIPFPKSTFGFLESRIQVENQFPGEVMSNCLSIAQMWQKSLKRLF